MKYAVIIGVISAISIFKSCCAYSCQNIVELKQGEVVYLNFDPNKNSSRTTYNPGDYCEWLIVSTNRVRFYCDAIRIPYSENCYYARLAIDVDYNGDEHRYCGSQNGVWLDSVRYDMRVRLITSQYTSPGSFSCLAYTIDDNTCDCGWNKLESRWAAGVAPRIVGGRPTKINEYPSMAAIYSLLKKGNLCDASIISNQHAVTAAHCLLNVDRNSIAIIAGAHYNPPGPNDFALQFLGIQGYEIHPWFTETSGLYDIALIKVKTPIVFSPRVGPICLPIYKDGYSFAGEEVTLLGWGTTSFGGRVASELQKVEVHVLSSQQCREYEPSANNTQICTYGPEKDACQLDTGGPVIWKNPSTKRNILVGVIASGSSCGEPVPALNTRVTAFVPWILSLIKGSLYCRAE